MRLLAVIYYLIILCGSLVLGMYIKFDDAKKAVKENENMFNDK